MIGRMGLVIFNRPKRVAQPAMPRGDVLLEPPPEIPPPPTGRNFGAVLRMLPMVAGGLAMGLMMTSGGMMGSRGPLGGVIGVLYGISMVGMMLSSAGRGNDDQAQQLDSNRRDYFRYLGQTRRAVREAADNQRRAVEFRHPSPDVLWTVVGGRRMWERRPEDEDFGSIRISVGAQQFAKRLTPPEAQPVEDLEPLTTGALRRFMRTHRLVSDVPLSINLDGFDEIRLVGDPASCRRLGFAMVAQAATWHSSNDLRIMVAAAPNVQPQWQWAKWLPHLQSPAENDGAGPARLFATSASELTGVGARAQSATEVSPRLNLVVVDEVNDVKASAFATPATRATGLFISAEATVPRRVDAGVAVLELLDSGELFLHRRTPKGAQARTPLGRADQIEMVYAEMLARQLAPFRLPARVSIEEEPEVVFEAPRDYPTMVGVGDPLTLDVRQAWKPRPLHQHLRIPFGTGEQGQPVELDIKESAQGGMGPHGICIGATGSGKSEFLRTLVLGMAMTHSPEQLNFILVDFKGGATFLGLDALPHVSATITNLEGELILVDRMQDAIGGEMDRRMEVLRAAGNFKNREDYEIARQAGADLEPMPSLFFIVDEFSELLTARPEFIDLFLQIGRVGRSIAVHLLLASQRLEEGKLRGLDTFLSYRIALRTFSASESRSVIGVPDAYELPSPPGNGYLKEGTKDLVRFKAAYVSGPWHGTPSAPTTSSTSELTLTLPERTWTPPVLEFTTEHVPIVTAPVEAMPAQPVEVVETPAPVVAEEEEDETLLGLVVGRLRGHGWPAHQVWLPPLDAPPTLDGLLGPIGEVPGRGLQVLDASRQSLVSTPVALIDRPRQQRRDPMWMDFSGSGGHMGVVGGPQSGKSMALRTAIASMALTHSPSEASFYVLDFGGGALMALRDLPHVGSVCGRLDVDRVRRTIAEVNSLRTSRELMFAKLGIDSMASYRRGRRDGSIPPDRFATDVYLVVDGWMTLRNEFEDLEATIQTLGTTGLGFGIHLWLASNKWGDIRAGLRDSIQSRLELKLGDPFDSEVNRKAQGLVPVGRPGRGITSEGLHLLAGLPRMDGVEDAETVSAGQRALIDASRKAWAGPRAAEVRMLPGDLPLSALPAISYDGVNRTIPFAIDELELSPVVFDPTTEPHVAFIGGPESGKSNILRTLLRGLITRYTPREARIVIADYRRSLLGEVETEHLLPGGYVASSQAADDLFRQLADAVGARLPGQDVTQQQLRDRSWWSGSEIFVVIDDYDLVGTSMSNPVSHFAGLISQAQDIGLHFIVARASGGSARAFFSDPLFTRMKDQLNPALIMSGDRDEGGLFGGVRPSAQPVGRGTWVTRSGKVLIQTAHAPVDES